MIGGLAVMAVVLLDVVFFLKSDPMVGVDQLIEKKTDYKRKDLICLSAGDSKNLPGQRCWAVFQIKNLVPDRIIRINAWRPLAFLPWQVRGFEIDPLA
ncbi:MAG: hypothetical protein P8M80_19120 [Pirellulaceae bacterium]|nr:hypothetical protein [Pirellulaceae bacterium]